MRRRSVAEELRSAERARVAALSPEARVRLALELGRRSLESFAAREGLSLEAARATLERRRQARRRRSRCLEDLLA
jgi:hypothetical protein